MWYGGRGLRHQSNDNNDLAISRRAGPYEGPYEATKQCRLMLCYNVTVDILNWFGIAAHMRRELLSVRLRAVSTPNTRLHRLEPVTPVPALLIHT